MKRISLRVRKEHFDAIESGEKDLELRADTPYWAKRLVPIFRDNMDFLAVFTSGKRVHRRWGKRLEFGKPEEYLGRPLSEQGRLDIPTENCWAIYLGEELKE